MNKEELKKEITKTKEQLAKLQQALKEKRYRRFRPNKNEEYFIVDGRSVSRCININEDSLDVRYNFYNCFRTKEEALTEFEKILTRRQLEDIAERLNRENFIDWTDLNQVKYCLGYNFEANSIYYKPETKNKTQGTVYCLKYTVNMGVQFLINKVVEIIEGKENE